MYRSIVSRIRSIGEGYARNDTRQDRWNYAVGRRTVNQRPRSRLSIEPHYFCVGVPFSVITRIMSTNTIHRSRYRGSNARARANSLPYETRRNGSRISGYSTSSTFVSTRFKHRRTARDSLMVIYGLGCRTLISFFYLIILMRCWIFYLRKMSYAFWIYHFEQFI